MLLSNARTSARVVKQMQTLGPLIFSYFLYYDNEPNNYF